MIQIETNVKASLEKVWEYWTSPEHIVKWNAASDDWHTTAATNDLKVGGVFSSTMAAKDGSFSFDFSGTYTRIDHASNIEYVLADGRKVIITFQEISGYVHILERFDPESENPEDLQQQGWQAILDNFKKYTENN